MKNRFKIFFSLLLILFFIGFLYISQNLRNQEGLFKEVKKAIPNNIKFFLLDTIFIHKKQEYHLEKINNLETENTILKNLLVKRNFELSQVPLVFGEIPLKKIDKDIGFNFENSHLFLEKFKTLYLNVCKHEHCKAGSAYIESFDKKLFIASANGIFGYSDLENFSDKNFSMKVIKSNITDLIKYDLFYKDSQFGIKDLLIHNNKLYISLSYELSDHCFNTSILFADLNLKKLEFEEFFVPETCIGFEFVNFNPHHSGGRLFPYSNEKIFFSSGEYKKMIYAQDSKNVFGKIVLIDINSRKHEIISMGHRNPQGLYYDSDNNIIFSTDHGPQGGDEINFADLNQKKIHNFGWPISSYGVHYGGDPNNILYEEAPLHKSHKEYGFNEPLKYFDDGIGISQVVVVPKKFNNLEKKQIFVASMGNDLSEGDLSLHHLILNNDFSIFEHRVIPINERIRDLIYVEELNKFFLFLESTGSIGVIDNR